MLSRCSKMHQISSCRYPMPQCISAEVRSSMTWWAQLLDKQLSITRQVVFDDIVATSRKSCQIPTAKNEEGKKTKPIFLGGLLYITISHRIHGAAIYGNIYHQDTPNVSIYTSTMDPMGMPLYHDSSHKCETDGLSMSPYVSNRRLRSCRTTETSTSWSLLLRAAWRSSRDGWWGSCMFMSSSWFLCKDGNNICS